MGEGMSDHAELRALWVINPGAYWDRLAEEFDCQSGEEKQIATREVWRGWPNYENTKFETMPRQAIPIEKKQK